MNNHNGVIAILGYIKNRILLSHYIANLSETVKGGTGANQFWRSIIESSGYDFNRSANSFIVFFRLEHVLEKINGARSTNYLLRRYPERTVASFFDQLQTDLGVISKTVLSKDRFEAALVYRFLDHIGLSDAAGRHFRIMGILPDFVNLRHYFYANLLARYIKSIIGSRLTLNIVEIGGGGGRFKEILKLLLSEYSVTYIDIDLPEMLTVGVFSHMNLHPAVAVSINNFDKEVRDYYVDTTRFGCLAVKDVDLFINTHSFQEMSSSEIGKYFKFVYAAASSNALFFNTNWAQKKMADDNDKFYNNSPENYPYRTSGGPFLINEEDQFYVFAKREFGYKPYLKTRTVLQHIVGC